MYGTFWALVPPILAIVLALITKEAYSSLFIGVMVGALLAAGFSPVGALNNIRDEYVNDLGAGALDPSKIEELNSRLYGSGLQSIMDAKQEQLNKWREENGK